MKYIKSFRTHNESLVTLMALELSFQFLKWMFNVLKGFLFKREAKIIFQKLQEILSNHNSWNDSISVIEYGNMLLLNFKGNLKNTIGDLKINQENQTLIIDNSIIIPLSESQYQEFVSIIRKSL